MLLFFKYNYFLKRKTAINVFFGSYSGSRVTVSRMCSHVTCLVGNRAALSRNRYGVEKTVDTHKILINAITFYVCLQEI
jgi:hypothetical protein